MNFQAVSVGQKLAKDNSDGSCTDDTGSLNGQPGGYKDGAGTPTDVLAYGLQKTDEALGNMIQALKSQSIYDSTLFIVTSKHGQSPINPVKLNKPGHFADLVAACRIARQNPGGTWPSPRRRLHHRLVRPRAGRRYRADLVTGPEPDRGGRSLSERQRWAVVHR